MVELVNSIYSCEQLQVCENLNDTENQAMHIKCKRCYQRQSQQETISPTCFQRSHKNLNSKILSCCRTSVTKSLRFCLYSFIIWTLAVAPLLNDLAKNSLPFKFRISLGGVILTQACHPGSTNGGGTRPRPAVNLSPFQRNEYIPKMSEQTIGASGPAEGPIYRNTRRFSDELSPNWNPDIVFRDEEHTNEDRMMTKRCTDRLNVLAIWVANQWPGVKLRVTEGWNDPDTERIRPENALHYEGRAVDITTNDEDFSKYPILARLAVEAGFDWVYYKRFHVHCSVKSDSSDAALKGGCFPGDALVPIPGGGVKQMQELLPGDEVFSLDSNGNLAPDVLLTFMDVQFDVRAGRRLGRAFVSITTEEGHNLHLTRNHLVYVSSAQTQSNQSKDEITYQLPPQHDLRSATAVFAGNVKIGQYLFVAPSLSFANLSVPASVSRARVASVEVVSRSTGAFAPLTTRGNIVVDQTLASCYAVIESDTLAHVVMAPTRYYHILQQWLASWYVNNCTELNTSPYDRRKSKALRREEGISIYSKVLYDMGYSFFSSSMFWGD